MTDEVTRKVEDFFKRYTLRHYRKGQILILNGETPEHIFHLVTGNVKQYDVTYRGEEVIINTFKPPAFFPMSFALNDAPNHFIYEAASDIDVQQAPIKDVLVFIRENPDVVLDLLSRVYRGMDGVLGRMVQLMSGSAHSRLIYELILEARRFGTMQPDGGCMLKMSEKDIGALSGLSRETVSRELTKLKSENVVDITNKSIFIRNMKILEAKLGQEI